MHFIDPVNLDIAKKYERFRESSSFTPTKAREMFNRWSPSTYRDVAFLIAVVPRERLSSSEYRHFTHDVDSARVAGQSPEMAAFHLRRLLIHADLLWGCLSWDATAKPAQDWRDCMRIVVTQLHNTLALTLTPIEPTEAFTHSDLGCEFSDAILEVKAAVEEAFAARLGRFVIQLRDESVEWQTRVSADEIVAILLADGWDAHSHQGFGVHGTRRARRLQSLPRWMRRENLALEAATPE